jgi:transposase
MNTSNAPVNRGSGDIEILNSWKEIANYLNCGVRTVQRWEEQYKLPVRRPAGNGRSSVVAFKSEIDRWLRSESKKQSGAPITVKEAGPGWSKTRELLIRSQALRENVLHSSTELSLALKEVVGTLEKMVAISESGKRFLRTG